MKSLDSYKVLLQGITERMNTLWGVEWQDFIIFNVSSTPMRWFIICGDSNVFRICTHYQTEYEEFHSIHLIYMA